MAVIASSTSCVTDGERVTCTQPALTHALLYLGHISGFGHVLDKAVERRGDHHSFACCINDWGEAVGGRGAEQAPVEGVVVQRVRVLRQHGQRPGQRVPHQRRVARLGEDPVFDNLAQSKTHTLNLYA